MNNMNFNLNQVTLNEMENDGKTLWLYYDEMAGLYLAFGLSAYYSTMVVEPHISYSEALQMPVALLRRSHILSMRQSLTKVEHKEKTYYRFEMKSLVGEEGYDRWAQKAREDHLKIYKH